MQVFQLIVFKKFPINIFVPWWLRRWIENVRGQKEGGTADSRVSLIKALEVH